MMWFTAEVTHPNESSLLRTNTLDKPGCFRTSSTISSDWPIDLLSPPLSFCKIESIDFWSYQFGFQTDSKNPTHRFQWAEPQTHADLLSVLAVFVSVLKSEIFNDGEIHAL